MVCLLIKNWKYKDQIDFWKDDPPTMDYAPETWISKLSINYALIPIKVVYFGFAMSKFQSRLPKDIINEKKIEITFLFKVVGLSMPFLTLQALEIGLSIQDVSVCYGLLPIFAFMGITAIGITE